jgi:hypothetical protein
MKTLFAIAVACALACAGPALAADTKAADTTKAAAADTAKTPNSQQEKMKACNEQATDKKGDERKAFMKTCLSAKPMAAAKPESKMAMCNKKTAGLTKDERAKAQSECMKGA